jgi:type IV pilus assembly protein PilA
MIKVNRNSKGFTLIELLIVIAIIGILAAIAIPAYTGYTKKSKMSGVTSAMGALKNAIIAYHTETGSVTVADNSNYATIYGITVPGQYVSSVSVASADGTAANISATIQNIGSDVNTGIVYLNTTSASGGSWAFSGSNAAVNSLLPK